MAKPTTRKQFTEYCLKRLGWPVIDINVDEDQVQDRIDDALQFYQDYHYDGNEKIYMKHQFTQEDIDRRWIYCPDAIISVTQVFPWDDSSASMNMFDLRYQLRLHDLYDFTSVSYVSYEITMQHIRTLNLLFSGTPQFRFNRHLNKLYLDINWESDAHVGTYCIMECYRSLAPDNVTLSGTITSNSSANVMVDGTGTKFTQELVEGDVIHLSTGEDVQVNRIAGDSYMTFYKAPITPLVNVTMSKEGISDVWNDRFLKQYATAKIKYQWGTNLSKFAGVQLPGGVTLDGPRIMQEAQLEIDKIEEEMQIYNVLPNEIFVG
ncbi:hypothetical protein M0R04_05445 [Candidatus Dojkabacteria bacterium]|jgi:hypothetical protein|nr:hypothetical protein [Candidatus Dojkabacteria bacterium]